MNTTVGSSPAEGGTSAITIDAALTVNAGITFVIRGPITQGNTSIVLEAGSIFEYDASQATTPLSQQYAWTCNGFSKGNRQITCNGTSGSHVTIRSNASGGNGYFYAAPGYNDSMWFDADYTDFQRIGDSTNSAIRLNVISNTTFQSFANCDWDADCGLVEMVENVAVGCNWSFTDCRFRQTNAFTNGSGDKAPLLLKAAAGTVTGQRVLLRCSFVEPPTLTGLSLDSDYCVFLNSFGYSAHTQVWAGMDKAFIRQQINNSRAVMGDVNDGYLIIGRPAAALDTGTASSATSTTLTDSGKSWATNAWDTDGNIGYLVEITAGTGIGQRRYIVSNTGTVLTIARSFDVTPDATSTYALYEDVHNPHCLTVTPNLASGHIAINGMIFENTGCDSPGDVVQPSYDPDVTMEHKRCVVLPNAAGDCTGVLHVRGGSTYSPPNGAMGALTLEHNTCFTGAQSMLSICEGGTNRVNTIASLKSNIVWSVPGRTYYDHGGAPGQYKVATVDNTVNPALDDQDVITAGAANYNCGYGLDTGFESKGYHYNASTVPGANDVEEDPGFVDPWRNITTWATAHGSVATTYRGKLDDAIGYLFEDPTLIDELRTHVLGGVTPTNVALEDAGHDSVTIGAVEGDFTADPDTAPYPQVIIVQ